MKFAAFTIMSMTSFKLGTLVLAHKIFWWMRHYSIIRVVTKGARGSQFPGHRITMAAPNCPTMSQVLYAIH